LVFLIPGKITGVDPRFATNNNDTKISRVIAPGLTSVDHEDMEPRLLLAESLKEVEPLVWEATLRPDIKFSDGTPLSAFDVAATYASVMAEGSTSVYQKGFLERFAKVEAVDSQRVRFFLVKPLATLLSDLDFGVLSAKGMDRKEIIGAGAFALESYSPEGVSLARNEHYFGQLPPMKKIEFRLVRDGNARALMLAGGSADMTQNGVRIDLVNKLTSRPRLRLAKGPSNILTYFMMNNSDPLLADPRVRRAIAHAIDRDSIIRAKFHGYAVKATGLLAPSHWAYNGDVPKYEYDPGKARALLDEAGFPDPDGPGGKPRLSLSYKTSADQFRLALARLIAEQLGDVGILVEVRSFEFGTFFADIKKGNYQLGSMQTAPIGEPDWTYNYFHSARIPSEEQPHGGNRWRYRNPQVDELTELGRLQMDRAERVQTYAEVQRLLAEDVPIIPLWHEDNLAVANVDVGGYPVFPNARLSGVVSVTKTSKSGGEALE